MKHYPIPAAPAASAACPASGCACCPPAVTRRQLLTATAGVAAGTFGVVEEA